MEKEQLKQIEGKIEIGFDKISSDIKDLSNLITNQMERNSSDVIKGQLNGTETYLEIRYTLKMTQREVSQLAGVHEATWSCYETGKRSPSGRTKARMESIFGFVPKATEEVNDG